MIEAQRSPFRTLPVFLGMAAWLLPVSLCGFFHLRAEQQKERERQWDYGRGRPVAVPQERVNLDDLVRMYKQALEVSNTIDQWSANRAVVRQRIKDAYGGKLTKSDWNKHLASQLDCSYEDFLLNLRGQHDQRMKLLEESFVWLRSKLLDLQPHGFEMKIPEAYRLVIEKDGAFVHDWASRMETARNHLSP